ncbi:leucine carboxyl methyltransferase [Histoplasma ohiense]|nr:leucine carboxyl methyltransferase [Histoplasma ohiense (nom. inval.)]
MYKKFKSQASSSRAASGGFGSSAGAFGGFSTDSMTQRVSSSLSYIAEPPDLSKISEPQLVVSFKNLLKKDATTKTKALEDLQGFLCAQDTRRGNLEDGLIEVWIKVYPRMSIDICRRVRQLAHILQGLFVSLYGRRIAPYISRVIGAWLAGLYDSDKLVFRAAQESIVRAFPTEEKRQSLWRVYRSSIFEFVIDAVLEQSPQTLSDQRTVRPDEAEAKHARVVSTALQVLNQLLAKSSTVQLDKDSDFITSHITSKSLWSFSYHEDPFVRRSTYDLLRTLLSVERDLIEWRTVSNCFLSKALPKNQLGSAIDFSNVLLTLTKERPQLWTSDYSGKVSATKRLYQYIKKGSEGANAAYWENLHILLKSIPFEILIRQPVSDDSTIQDANQLMETIHDSVLSREEQGGNLGAAWSCFIDTGFWISSFVSDKVALQKFLKSQISPILEQHILGLPDNSRWSLNGKFAVELCAKTFILLAEHTGAEILHGLWMSLSDRLIQTVKLSSPEKASGFKDSQDSICAQAKRLFELEGQVLTQITQTNSLSFISSIFQDAGTPLLQASLELLRSRNGKPYGAASMIDEALSRVPDIATQVEGLGTFLIEDIAQLLFSPAADRLISVLFGSRGKKGFEGGLKNSIDAFLDTDLGSSALPGLQKLFSCITSPDIEAHPNLELLIMKDLNRALHNTREAWMEIIVLIKNRASRNEIAHRILNSLVYSLSSQKNIREVLYGLFQIALECPEVIREFVNSPDGSQMVSKILYIAESSTDEVAQLAGSLQTHIRDIIKGESATRSSIDIVQQNFNNVGIESLSIDALVDVASEVLAKSSVEDKPRILSRLLPTRDQWEQALDPFLRRPLKASASISKMLAGAVFLADTSFPEGFSQDIDSVPRDSYRFSSGFRLTFYVTKVLSSTSLEFIDQASREILFFYFPLATQLVNDDVSLEGPKGFFDRDMPDIRDESAELVSEARLIIKGWLLSATMVTEQEKPAPSNIFDLWEKQFGSMQGTSPKSYNIAETFSRIVAERDSSGTARSAESFLTRAKQIDGPANPFVLTSVVAAFRDFIAATPSGVRLCNELISDSTGFKAENASEGLRKIVSLNLLISGESNIAQSVPKPRLVFLVKHLVDFLQSQSPPQSLVSEILKLLVNILPLIREIYGSHWSDVFGFLQNLWDDIEIVDESLPVLYSSLRLFACLKSLATGESNDDLVDAWTASRKIHSPALIRLLAEFDSSLSYDEPLKITANILARQISGLPIDHVEDINDLFSILSAPNRDIQRAAYDVLHRAIPKLQEAVTLNVALSDAVASLPDELISLLLEVPAINIITQAKDDDRVWIGLRCYLLSWKTVFDHFKNASLPVQESYVSNIKENDCLNPFLEFTFDFLQYPHGKLIDASKFDIRSFSLDESDPAQKETQCLLVHLYYLCLKYLPNLTKVWWIDSKKRVKGQVETWTEKYISPLIIEDSLRNVNEWFSAQNFTNEDQPLQVKVSRRAAEIIASVEVDEDSPPTSVAIYLPSTYPLQQAVVEGRARVAVDEKKWRSWLLTIQGVIMFSNGNLVDGLLAFRRNVQGALKGQSECAICYSVISANMQTPNKRCATCKNTFHSDCLFRWFKSSNASSCPLCRNNFPYS